MISYASPLIYIRRASSSSHSMLRRSHFLESILCNDGTMQGFPLQSNVGALSKTRLACHEEPRSAVLKVIKSRHREAYKMSCAINCSEGEIPKRPELASWLRVLTDLPVF